jgi:hypothetical protein
MPNGRRRGCFRRYGDSALNSNARSGDNAPQQLSGSDGLIKCTVTVTLIKCHRNSITVWRNVRRAALERTMYKEEIVGIALRHRAARGRRGAAPTRDRLALGPFLHRRDRAVLAEKDGTSVQGAIRLTFGRHEHDCTGHDIGLARRRALLR